MSKNNHPWAKRIVSFYWNWALEIGQRGTHIHKVKCYWRSLFSSKKELGEKFVRQPYIEKPFWDNLKRFKGILALCKCVLYCSKVKRFLFDAAQVMIYILFENFATSDENDGFVCKYLKIVWRCSKNCQITFSYFCLFYI